MHRRVLYFPYIRVPQSRWLAQMLLYWDEVSSIVPYEYIDRPEELGHFMQELLQQELVVQVQPGAYLQQLPNFSNAFGEYLLGLDGELERRRARFIRYRPARIHIEKLDNAGSILVDFALARLDRYPWYHVESRTAADFMAYLATCLGQLDEVSATPVTDKHGELDRFLGAGVAKSEMESQLSSIRLEVLADILPLPTGVPPPQEIRQFRDRHGQLLGNFRRHIERELVVIASLSDEELQRRRRDLLKDEFRETRNEIEAALKESGWTTSLGTVSGIIAAVPGVPAVFGLVNAVIAALAGRQRVQIRRDLAYAAYAYAAFGAERRFG